MAECVATYQPAQRSIPWLDLIAGAAGAGGVIGLVWVVAQDLERIADLLDRPTVPDSDRNPPRPDTEPKPRPIEPVVPEQPETPGQPRLGGEIAMDADPVIQALDWGMGSRVDIALRGRSPVVSPQARVEIGAPARFEAWLAARYGRIGRPHNPTQVAQLQAHAASIGRVLHEEDARVLSSAMQENLALMTNDDRLGNFMKAIGYPSEKW
jgi:hypothetical protein